MMKIDMFAHFAPERLVKELSKFEPKGTDSKKMTGGISTMFNLEKRLQMIERHEGYTQVVSIGGGPVEAVAKGQDAIDLARLANDCAAELCMKYPMHFLAGVGALPLNDTEASLKEIDSAINDLKLKGFMIHTPLFSLTEDILPPGQGKPLDSPELIPIYEKMAQYDLPLWIHPNPLCDARLTEYHGEKAAKYYGWQIYGWPYQDTLAQVHLVFGGILEKFPNLKFLNHHGGSHGTVLREKARRKHQYGRDALGSAGEERLKQEPARLFQNVLCGYCHRRQHARLDVRSCFLRYRSHDIRHRLSF